MNFLGKKTDFHKDLRTRSPSRCANIVIMQKHPNLSYSAENETPSGEEWHEAALEKRQPRAGSGRSVLPPPDQEGSKVGGPDSGTPITNLSQPRGHSCSFSAQHFSN